MNILYVLYLFHSTEALRFRSVLTPVLSEPEMIKEVVSDFAGFFGQEENIEEDGEAEYLIDLLRNVGITPILYKNLIAGINYNMTGRQKVLWALAFKEEKDLGQISDFGNAIAKFPRSWVDQITALNDTKIIRYMFSGSFSNMQKVRHRQWLPAWVKEHFGPGDYFRATDANTPSWKSLGVFDQTQGGGGFRPKSCGGTCMRYDESYWAKMRQSKFTLCPGGDAPWSYRFYESFLAGTIPIINSYEDDWKDRPSTKWINMIGYQHKMSTDNPHVFDEELVKLNRKKFIRYQTFIEGDNNPAKDEADGFKF